MKSGVYLLNHDTGFKNMKKDLVKRYGRETTEQIWEKAGRNLEELCVRYAHLPKAVKVHTDGNMFRMAAFYLALKEAYPDDAMEILEIGVEKEGKRVARFLSMLLYLPGMKRMMLFVFAKMLDSFFGEEAEFQCTKHCISGDEVRFDIDQCPYCKYLTEIGCPEIVRFSCEVDQWIYGNLPGLAFERTGTIGTGADRCDFCLKRVKA
ncbi:MAG: L-2-amino-thiazoline-4-carboxylic acid hydrolase [Lachnospiraceae bacterium]|nr:L-2-amino-thiazoline-4-carboxylic acid hydrolase [Lachnospiraceae bacterium]